MMLKKQFLPLLLAPLISCGCPSKPTNTTPSSTVSVPEPTVSVPKPEPKPKAEVVKWKKASDEEVLKLVSTTDSCLIVWFQSNKEDVKKVMTEVLETPEVVTVINKRFVPFIWDGSIDMREGFFGVDSASSNLLIVPTDDSTYILFDPFDDEGNLQGSVEEVAEELARGLSSDAFSSCEETKKESEESD